MTQDFTFSDGAPAAGGSITVAALIESLKIHAPTGVELPRDPDTNGVHEPTITRWVQEAAKKINERRGVTTILETEITTVRDQQDYTLPVGTRRVKQIVRGRYAPTNVNSVLGVPINAAGLSLPMQIGSVLPSGQYVDSSLDLISRQQSQRARREDEWEVFEGKIRLHFPTVDDEVIRVRYEKIDTDVSVLPVDYFDTVLLYLRYMTLDWFLAKNPLSISQQGDSFNDAGMSALVRAKLDLHSRWITTLNTLGPELNN